MGVCHRIFLPPPAGRAHTEQHMSASRSDASLEQSSAAVCGTAVASNKVCTPAPTNFRRIGLFNSSVKAGMSILATGRCKAVGWGRRLRWCARVGRRLRAPGRPQPHTSKCTARGQSYTTNQFCHQRLPGRREPRFSGVKLFSSTQSREQLSLRGLL